RGSVPAGARPVFGLCGGDLEVVAGGSPPAGRVPASATRGRGGERTGCAASSGFEPPRNYLTRADDEPGGRAPAVWVSRRQVRAYRRAGERVSG
ncbi:hypothetical protein ACPF8X_27065, partial [Streptomyces sp. G35A]